ncbi:MAG: hypothetical protein HZB71_02020 [Betaproteobacteria bacterium]|nr:hypothetical protein [Betaproteobacteria bacterium]
MFHPSGGLTYHLRAWRYRDALWRPFHEQVGRWLTAWRPGAVHLVLAGPSGGYALNREFLERFQRVTVLEPDPLARRILGWRFSSISFEFAVSPLAGPGGFAALAQAWPGAAFLFCNLLGQTLVGQGEDFERAAWLAELEPALAGREWASWHDLASTERAPDQSRPFRLNHAQALEAVLAHLWQGGELTIRDHECEGLCPHSAREYALWNLRPGHWHLVEWLHA